MSDLTTAVAQMQESEGDYERAHAYYTGKVPEHFGSRWMRRKLERVLTAYKLNLAKIPVNVVADRLEVAAVTVPGDDTLTKILQTEVWDANDLLLEAPGFMRRACEYGDSYALVWPEANEDGETEGVRISYHSPMEARMVYDPADSRRKLYYVHVWTEPGPGKTTIRRADVFYADRLEQWVQDAKNKATDETSWEPFYSEYRTPEPDELFDPSRMDEELGIWPILHEYDEVPAFHFRTDSPWGVPLHEDAYGPQDAITKLVATHMGTVDFQGFPQRYALEDADPVSSDDDPGDEWLDPNNGSNAASAASGGPGSRLKSGPAEVWWLKGVKGVGQFAVSDPKVFTEPAQFYMRMMAQTCGVPMHYFDPTGDAPSGESLRTAEAPLVKRVRDLIQRFGHTWSDVLSFALKVLTGATESKVDVRFAPPATVDDGEGWTVAEAKIRSGVPVRQVLLEAGYTAEQVDDWIKPDTNQDLLRRVAILQAIGDAIQKLGAGVGFGIVTPEQVSGIIAGVLEDAPAEGA